MAIRKPLIKLLSVTQNVRVERQSKMKNILKSTHSYIVTSCFVSESFAPGHAAVEVFAVANAAALVHFAVRLCAAESFAARTFHCYIRDFAPKYTKKYEVELKILS